ncbi:hypothetical protein E0L36_26415 [Streptomyces sp. AJS327]|uniref:hypothetical protein n=1 Tax=Streptomyces sp. AJS327 TaxID=2545265 RepID=UPI0015DD9B3D|nr:hypothetical protein [Streptomyces sp. AJS327]MBA0054261.1 hypothetical protein [Streptomyces sp. AJS327]
MTDRRRGAAPSDSSSREPREDNPFAPPPEGRPERPWQPRDPGDSSNGEGDGSSGQDSGSDGDSGSGQNGGRWGSQWSSRQPGRGSGGFGRPSNGQDEGDGGRGNGSGGRGMRWDPRDRLQRHARYSLHTGIWALFFVLFSLPQIALLLGALSLYWGINALRGRRQPQDGEERERRGGRGRRGAEPEDVAGTDRHGEPEGERQPTPGGPPVAVGPAQAAKAQRTAAISGLVTSGLALCLVAATFTVELVYRDYYACEEDSLTTASREECDRLLPDNLRSILDNRP